MYGEVGNEYDQYVEERYERDYQEWMDEQYRLFREQEDARMFALGLIDEEGNPVYEDDEEDYPR